MDNINVEGFIECPRLALRLVRAGVDIAKVNLLQPMHDDRLLQVWYRGDCVSVVSDNQDLKIEATPGNIFLVKDRLSGDIVLNVTNDNPLPHDKIEGISKDEDILLVMMGKHPNYYVEIKSTNLWCGSCQNTLTGKSTDQIVGGPYLESFERLLIEGYYLNGFA